MPNQTDPNQVADTTSTPPVSVPNTDIPPLPDFMNVPASQTPSEPQTPPADDSSGSAAPSDLPPVMATPKKKFGGGKIIATILGLVLLVGGIGAGVVLTQQQQLFQQKATETCSSDCTTVAAGSSCPSDRTCNGGFVAGTSNNVRYCCKTQTVSISGNACTQTNRSCGNCGTGTQSCIGTVNGAPIWGPCTGGGACAPGATETCTTTIAGGATTTGSRTCSSSCQWGNCSGNVTTVTCSKDACNGVKCSDNQTCTNDGKGSCSCTEANIMPNPLTKCSGTGSHGGTLACSTQQACSGTNKVAHSDIACTGNNAMCCETLPAGSTDSCAGVGCSGSGCSVSNLYPTCYVNHYWCKTKSPGGCSSNLIERAVSSASFNQSCGTEQIDIYCPSCGAGSDVNSGGKYLSKTYDSDCGGSSPTAPACAGVTAYDPSWVSLGTPQLSALSVGAQVNFCVAGSAPSGTFDKAQFTIKGVQQPETTTVRPGSTDFCQSYTILSTDTTVGVTAKIHHSTLGWY